MGETDKIEFQPDPHLEASLRRDVETAKTNLRKYLERKKEAK